jgi:hypothetical protein
MSLQGYFFEWRGSRLCGYGYGLREPLWNICAFSLQQAHAETESGID